MVAHVAELAFHNKLVATPADAAKLSYQDMQALFSPDQMADLLNRAFIQDQVSLHTLRASGLLSVDLHIGCCSPDQPNKPSVIRQALQLGVIQAPDVSRMFTEQRAFLHPQTQDVYLTSGLHFPASVRDIHGANLFSPSDADAATIIEGVNAQAMTLVAGVDPQSTVLEPDDADSTPTMPLPGPVNSSGMPSQTLVMPEKLAATQRQDRHQDDGGQTMLDQGASHRLAQGSFRSQADGYTVPTLIESQQAPIALDQSAKTVLDSDDSTPQQNIPETKTAQTSDDPTIHMGVGQMLPSNMPSGEIPSQTAALLDTEFKNIKEAEGLVGQRLGPWHLGSLLGKGGMGAVFKAQDEDGQVAAVKVILPALASASKYLQRFYQEAEVTKQLNHPGIVKFLGFAERPVPYLALEFIDGSDLKKQLKKRRKFSVDEALNTAKAMLLALKHAHDQGVVHRDLKPDNVLVRKDGRMLLADFGLGRAESKEERLTLTGQAMGTPYYMAPEQIDSAKHAGQPADLYAVGVILFHLLTGQPPFTGGQAAVFTAHIRKPAPDIRAWLPEAPRALAELIIGLMAKEPEQRPSSAQQVLDALDAIERELSATVEKSPGQSIGLEVGVSVNGWILESELGAGAMGKVFKATKDGQVAALKVMATTGMQNETAVARFEREIEVMQSLNSPNVVAIYDSGTANVHGTIYPFLAMEFASGKDLSDIVEQRGALPPGQAVAAALGAARALAKAHDKGVVHRDVKPENILLVGSEILAENVRLTDFGVAALTHGQSNLTMTTAAIGSPHFMAPEQARNDDNLDGRADVYALGASLFYMLTGSRMFAADTLEGLLLAHATELPERADQRQAKVPEELGLLVDWAVLKNPDDRPASMVEFMRDLEAWSHHNLSRERVKEIRKLVRAGRKPFEPSSRMVPVMLALGLVMALVLAAVGFMWDRSDPFAGDRKLLKLRQTELTALPETPKLISEFKTKVEEVKSQFLATEKDKDIKAPEELKQQVVAFVQAYDQHCIQSIRKGWDSLFAGAPSSDFRSRVAAVIDFQNQVRATLTERKEYDPSDLLAAFPDSTRGKGFDSLEKAFKALSNWKKHLDLAEKNAQSKAFESALSDLENASKFAVQAERAFAKGLSLLGKFSALSEDLKAKVDKGYSKLLEKAKEFEQRIKKPESTEAFKKAVSELEVYLEKSFPAGNERLRKTLSALKKSQSTEEQFLRKILEQLNKAEAATPTHYADLLSLLAPAFADEKYKKQESFPTLNKKHTELLTSRNSAAQKGFEALVKDQEQTIKAKWTKKSLSPADFDSAKAALVAFPKNAQIKGWPDLEARRAAVIKTWGEQQQSYVKELKDSLFTGFFSRQLVTRKVWKSQASAPRLPEFQKRMRDVSARLNQLRQFVKDSEESQWVSGQVNWFEAFNSDARLQRFELIGKSQVIGRKDTGRDYSPEHRVSLQNFSLDKYEVSVADYAQFLSFLKKIETGYRPYHKSLSWLLNGLSASSYEPKNWSQQLKNKNWPVRYVTWQAAQSFCRWAGRSLPFEEEWEAAARYGLNAKTRELFPYPWGGQLDAEGLGIIKKHGYGVFGHARKTYEQPGPVDKANKRALSRAGLYHMAGNVAEWTVSQYEVYPKGQSDSLDPDKKGSQVRVHRGGSYLSDVDSVITWYRSASSQKSQSAEIGFRCAAWE